MRVVLGINEELVAGTVLNGRRLLKKLPRLLGRKGPITWKVECLKCGKISSVKSGMLRRGNGCRCDMKGKPGKFRFLPLEERLKAHTTHRIKVRSWSGRHAKSVNHSVGERGHRDKGRVNWEMLEVSWKATEGKCWSCFAPLTLEPCKVHTVQWDHLLPLSRGGRNEQKNILPACRPCNAFKSDLTAEEFKLVITGQFVPLFGILRARHCQD